MTRLLRAAFALAAPLMLWACVLTPGKFVSSLTVNADRSFAFAYKGEVIAFDPSSSMKGLTNATDKKDEEGNARKETPKPDATAEAEADAKNREIAAALSKEAGYKSVVYRGKGKFDIDYAVSGNLTHSFLFPFNIDAQAIVPFLAIEVRQGGSVRIRAPGFANSQDNNSALGGVGAVGGAPGAGSKHLDGVFTLDTNAEIVSQNNEDGAKTVGGRQQVVWRATPLSKDAPVAVLRLK
jgi:hypothetical protein